MSRLRLKPVNVGTTTSRRWKDQDGKAGRCQLSRLLDRWLPFGGQIPL
jgi:hypothetical protein